MEKSRICVNVITNLIAHHHRPFLRILSKQACRTEFGEFDQYHHGAKQKKHAKQGKLSVSINQAHIC